MKCVKEVAPIKYAVVCEEMHQDGNKHYHAAVFYQKRLQMRGNPWALDGNQCNIKVIKSTNRDIRDSIAYVKKDGVWIEEGERPEKAINLQRIEKINYLRTHTKKEAIESGEFSFSEISKINEIQNEIKNKRPRDKERIVKWYYGGTGTGKTRTAMDEFKDVPDEDLWIASGNLKDFFNGYHGQRYVIFDDFRNGDMKFNQLLRITDRYRYTVNVKNGIYDWNADYIIFTSPYAPEDTFKTWNKKTEEFEPREDIEQLLRRLREIRQFGELCSSSQFVSD